MKADAMRYIKRCVIFVYARYLYSFPLASAGPKALYSDGFPLQDVRLLDGPLSGP